MNHSFEEIRNATLDLLAGRESGKYQRGQYNELRDAVTNLLLDRRSIAQNKGREIVHAYGHGTRTATGDADTFIDVFWGLFHEGLITLGLDDANNGFPWYRLSPFGRRIIENHDTHFYHDVQSYTDRLKQEIPDLDEVTLVYLKEAMQAFRSNCQLAATVMLGVAAEHIFLDLLEAAANSPNFGDKFAPAKKERQTLSMMTKFRKALETQTSDFPRSLREDLETRFDGIQSIIRQYRNEAGHPTGKFIDREQVYVLLQLFVSYAKKIYELKNYYSASRDPSAD